VSNEPLIDRHRRVMPNWVSLLYDQPMTLVRGEGRRVWDSEGREYLDFFAGILTTISGHNVPEVVGAVTEQAKRILHTSTLYMIEPAVELAERIASLAPIADAKVFFCNSGTEANETALLLAATYRRSNQILALRNSYHGRSFAAVGVTGIRSWSPSALSPLAVSYVHGGYKYRSPWRDLSDEEFIRVCSDDLRNVIETTTSGTVACMIAEPIQGVGGFVVPPDGFFGAMKQVLDEYGILFVSDEVQTGWGRTGDHFWGIESHDVRPDIMTFAKGLGNGLPIAGVIASPGIMDCLEANSISTFGGNPLCTSAALANLDYILANDLQTNARKVGEHLLGRLREAAERHPSVGEVRGKGLFAAVELVAYPSRDPDPAAAGRVLEGCRERGLLVGKGGLYGNCLRIAPPLTVTIEEADEAAGIIEAAVAEAEWPTVL
jgi:4-aminobutyrate aminotransferase